MYKIYNCSVFPCDEVHELPPERKCALWQRPSEKPEWAPAAADALYIVHAEGGAQEGNARRARARGLPLPGKRGAVITTLQLPPLSGKIGGNRRF